MSKDNNIPKKKTGLAHFFAAAKYSWNGFKFMLGEVPFKHQLCALPIILLIMFFTGAKPIYLLLTLCFGLAVMAVEAINSAIELIIDRTSPEISTYAQNTKDAGSLAVAILMIATGCVALYGIAEAFKSVPAGL